MRRGAYRWSVSLVVVALLASGCSLLERDRSGFETVVAGLAEAGIGVYAEPGDERALVSPAAPVSPVKLLEWQARALAVAAGHGAGTAASDLDGTVAGGQVDRVAVTASEVVAGWAEHGETPAARQAWQILADQGLHDGAQADVSDLIFPDLVLLLFTSDVATAGASLPVPQAAGPHVASSPSLRLAAAVMPAAQDVTSAPCSTLTNWVSEVIARVFDAVGRLQAPSLETGLGGFLDGIVNTIGRVVAAGVNFVIDAAHFVLENGLRVAIAPVMAIVARIAGIVGTLSQVASLVRPWAPSLTAEPSSVSRAVAPASGSPGQFTLTVDLGGFTEWPAAMADCAAQAGAPLPPLKPAGNPVTWQITEADLIERGEMDTALREDATAVAHFRSAQEPPFDNPRPGEAYVRAKATVQRDDTRQLQQLFAELIHEGVSQLVPPVGGLIAPPVWALLQPIVAEAFSALEHLRDQHAVVYLHVTYQVPGDGDEDDGPGAPADAAGPGRPAGTVREECPSVEAVAAVTGLQELHEGTTIVQPGFMMSCQYGAYLGMAAVQLTPPGTTLADYLAGDALEFVDVPGASRALWMDLGDGSMLIAQVGDRVVQVLVLDEETWPLEPAIALAGLVIETGS
jgi:hypothetical protein